MNIDNPPAPSVAIIGTEGAGKTVLTAVLAKRLGDPENGMFLNAQGPKTLKHVEKVWSILQGGDWPEGNPAGELFELRWKLEIDGHYVSDVRFVEAAGQDIRLLFEGEQFDDASSPALRSLAAYCGQSDIVMFLVNLADFIGKKNSESKASNEAAIKAAMDTLSQNGRAQRFCIVITQADLFHGEVERLGNWKNVLKAHLGNLYGAYVHSGKTEVFPVSAVFDTVVRDDGDGRMIRVPKADFKSKGLDELIGWLKHNTQVVAKQIRKQALAPSPQPSRPQVTPSQSLPIEPKKPGKSRLASTLSPMAAAVVCVVVLQKTCTRMNQPVDGRIWIDRMWDGPLAPIEEINWPIIIIITLIVSIIVFFVARIIEDDES